MTIERDDTPLYYLPLKDDYFKDLPGYDEELPIHNHGVKPYQMSIFNREVSVDNYPLKKGITRKAVGDFYENLAWLIYGGKTRLPSVNGDPFSHLISEIDIADSNMQKIREIKSAFSSQPFNLYDHQLAKYLLMQVGPHFEEFLIQEYNTSHPIIEFNLFRYGIRRIESEFEGKDLESLIERLSKETRGMISFPFGMICDLWYSHGSFISRYGEDPYDHITRISTTGLNNLMTYPERTLFLMNLEGTSEGLYLDSGKYTFKKFRFPSGVKIKGYEIKPFPILVFELMNYDGWLRSFKDTWSDNLKIMDKLINSKAVSRRPRVNGVRDSLLREVLGLDEETKANLRRADSVAPFEIDKVKDYNPQNDGFSGDEEDKK